MNFLGLFFLIVISPMIRLCKFPKCSAAVILTNLTKFKITQDLSIISTRENDSSKKSAIVVVLCLLLLSFV